MLKHILRFTLTWFALIGIYGFSVRGMTPQNSVVPPDETLYETGLNYLETDQYTKARLAFQTMINHYPDSDLTAAAYAAIGDSYFEEGGTKNWQQAVEQYKDFMVFFPEDPLVSDARMKIIAANIKLMGAPDRNIEYTIRARQEAERFLEQYPASEHASYVREFLAGIQDTVATIERIDIQGNRTIPEERIRFYIQSYPGDIYVADRLEFDLRALWKSNFFDDIQIRERDGEKGKIITFVLKEKPLIYSIEFAGKLAFFESEIYDALKDKKVGLVVDSRYDPGKIKAAERVIKILMIKNGESPGSIRAEIESISPAYVHVRFVFDEEP